jgi:arylsulfatase
VASELKLVKKKGLMSKTETSTLKLFPCWIKRGLSWKIVCFFSLILINILIIVSPVRAQAQEDPFVVWIVVDTLRADHLGSYGYPRVTTPDIDQVAADGVRFENAISPSSWTLPSYTSYLTGLYPNTHGMDRLGRYYEGTEDMLAEIMKKNGFKTAAFTANDLVSDFFGILRGFDTKIQYLDTDDISLTQNVIAWLNDPINTAGKVFLLVGYFGPHAPYCPPTPLLRDFIFDGIMPPIRNISCEDLRLNDGTHFPTAECLTLDYYPFLRGVYNTCKYREPDGTIRSYNPNIWLSAYDADIYFTDKLISQVIDKLREVGVWERTLLIITGDHGEMIAEKPEIAFKHGKSLDEGVIHVPLIVRSNLFDPMRVINQTVGTIDLVPTILEYSGVPVPDYIQGKSLLPLLMNQVPEKRNIAYSYLLYLTDGFPKPYTSARGDRYKLVEIGQQLFLYDLMTDPGETVNLANDPSYSHILSKMKDQLEAWRRRTESR